MSRASAAARLALLALAAACLIPFQLLARRAGWRVARRVPVWFHRLFLRLFGIRLTVIGAPPRAGQPSLVLSNHVSWLDIPVIGSLVPLSFIAKQEIGGWPLVGLLSRLQGSIFLDRGRKAATAEVNTLVAHRLADGDAIVLFPEGTTGDGVRLLPFRSSLVGAARAALSEPRLDQIQIQPLAVAYTARAGLPITRRELPEVAWYGDMDLGPHVGGFLRGGRLDVAVVWGEPIPFGPASDRKRASQLAEASVRAALLALRSRAPVPHAVAQRSPPGIPAGGYSLAVDPVVDMRAIQTSGAGPSGA